MYETLTYEPTDGIVTIALDRPDVYNAVTTELLFELNDAIRNATTDPGIYALILTGTGNAFCAGMDFNEMPSWADLSKEEYASFLWNAQNIVRQLRTSGTPSIAAINGPAIGGGCGFALACTFRFMGPDAFLRQNYPEIGIVPVDGSGWLLPRLIGEARALDFFLTGGDMTSSEAADLGLARTADDAVDASQSFATDLLDLPRTAVTNTIQLVTQARSFDEYCSDAIDAQWKSINDSEQNEAVSAFTENRSPAYDRDYTQ